MAIWIDDVIMALRRTPAERQLLAHICFRAGMDPAGACRDTNKELAADVDIHFQTVSDLIKKLEKDGLLSAPVNPKRANERAIYPISKILTPYKEKADRYKEKADRGYKSNAQTLSGNY